MNPWLAGPLTRNPYYRTPFRVARVPREVTAPAVVSAMIAQTRQLVAHAPGEHAIRGEPVTQAELVAAEQVLTGAAKRLGAELLHHAAEPPSELPALVKRTAAA